MVKNPGAGDKASFEAVSLSREALNLLCKFPDPRGGLLAFSLGGMEGCWWVVLGCAQNRPRCLVLACCALFYCFVICLQAASA